MFAVEIGRPNFKRHHAKFSRHKAREWHLKLRIGHEENALAAEQSLMPLKRALGAFTTRRDHPAEVHFIYAKCRGCRVKPIGRAFSTKREERIESFRAAPFKRCCGFPKERLGKQKACVWADCWQISRLARRQAVNARDAEFSKYSAKLILNNIRKRANDKERQCSLGCAAHFRNEAGEAGIFALRKSCFDPAARVVKHLHTGIMLYAQTLRRTVQVKLNHL